MKSSNWTTSYGGSATGPTLRHMQHHGTACFLLPSAVSTSQCSSCLPPTRRADFSDILLDKLPYRRRSRLARRKTWPFSGREAHHAELGATLILADKSPRKRILHACTETYHGLHWSAKIKTSEDKGGQWSGKQAPLGLFYSYAEDGGGGGGSCSGSGLANKAH